ncbi:MAG: hypothetical protein CSB24_06735 [Deltaproteobacteria bacterium]|nr:MAG: hypothetical protein CSB24_06735 [Deltaproteobacteria bacterium]
MNKMLKVLVVENNPAIVKLLTVQFEKQGCEVIAADNGLEALNCLDTVIPDIIVTDIIMPKIDGDQLCRIIRRKKEYRHIFLVIHSATVLENAEHLAEVGADIYIAKDTAQTYRQHVDFIIKEYRSGVRGSGEVLASENMVKSEITSELLLERNHARIIFNNVGDSVAELDQQGRIIQVNRSARRLFNLELTKIYSSRLTDYLEGEEADEAAAWLEQIAAGNLEQKEYRAGYKSQLIINGEIVTLDLVSMLDHGEIFVIVIIRVVTEQKLAERELVGTLQALAAVIESIEMGVLLLDGGCKTKIANQRFREMLSIPAEMIGSSDISEVILTTGRADKLQGSMLTDFVRKHVELIGQGCFTPMELVRANGLILQYQCVVLPDGGRLLTFYDITSFSKDRIDLEVMLEEERDRAVRDPLTGLYNLRFARERIELSIDLARRQNQKVALLFIDVDGFKEVNDSLGHEAGDEVLKMAAARLQGNTRVSDTAARIGGDEFVVLQTTVLRNDDVLPMVDKLVREISRPFELKTGPINLGVSIGIAVFPDDGQTDQELIKNADQAMYTVKKNGKHGYSFAGKKIVCRG